MDQSVDAVIVGAGHNSLACAMHLAAKDRPVAVCGQVIEAGGAVRGVRHDRAAVNPSLFAGSAVFRGYGDSLAAHGLAFNPSPDPFPAPSPMADGRAPRRLRASRCRGLQPPAGGLCPEAGQIVALPANPMRNHALPGFPLRAARICRCQHTHR